MATKTYIYTDAPDINILWALVFIKRLITCSHNNTYFLSLEVHLFDQMFLMKQNTKGTNINRKT